MGTDNLKTAWFCQTRNAVWRFPGLSKLGYPLQNTWRLNCTDVGEVWDVLGWGKSGDMLGWELPLGIVRSDSLDAPVICDLQPHTWVRNRMTTLRKYGMKLPVELVTAKAHVLDSGLGEVRRREIEDFDGKLLERSSQRR